MHALFTEDQLLIQETADKIASGGLERARAAARGLAVANDPTPELVADWSGLGVPEDAGGQGGALVDLALVIYALARRCEPGGFVAHAAAVQAAVAAGLSLEAVQGDGGRAALMGANDTAVAAPGVQGAAHVVVLDGQDVVVRAVESAEAFDGLDTARDWGRATPGAEMARAPGAVQAEARALALIAADLCGTAQGAIELAVDYASQRQQFGRPIGSYQAIGHRLAQAKGDLEAAWSLTLYACWAAENAPEEVAEAAAAAKAMAGDAAVFAAESCIQTHGGMGITMEADPHLFLKRALTSDAWLANAYACRRRLAVAALSA